MSVRSIFPNDYYTRLIDFPVQIDRQGTSCCCFKTIKRHFSCNQNQNLIAVHRKLKQIQDQLTSNAVTCQNLTDEIHQKKWRGAFFLKTNLRNLSSLFQKGNAVTEQFRTWFKVVNFIRKLLNLQPIEHYHYDPIDVKQFKTHVIKPAMKLTDRERISTRYLPLIQIDSNLPLPPNLTQENMQKLELGLLRCISFPLDGKHFCIKYDGTLQKFLFSYTTSKNAPRQSSFLKPKHYSYRSEPMNITEKKSDGTTALYSIHFTDEWKVSGWFNDVFSYAHWFNKLAMSENCEYTIPLSQWNLQIKMQLRLS